MLAPHWPGAERFDAAQPFGIDRVGSTTLRPSPGLARRVREMARATGSEVVVFGHALPLALLGPDLAAHGVPYVVCTHGREYWMARIPSLAAALRRATSRAQRVLAISEFTARAVRRILPVGIPLSLLPPCVDVRRFSPGSSGGEIRERYAIEHSSLIVCVSRLVPRKGQDALIRALPEIRRRIPNASLLLVGDGPYRGRLERMAAEAPPGSVVFAGEVSDEELPSFYAAADVFALPCRSRFAGLEVEGFGIVYLEAAAAGKPAVAGSSGGAAEAVVDCRTGTVVDGRQTGHVARALSSLLADREWSAAMGARGREHALRRFDSRDLGTRFGSLLRPR